MPIALLLPMLLPLIPDLIKAVPMAIDGVRSIFKAVSEHPETPDEYRVLLADDKRDLLEIVEAVKKYKPLDPDQA